MLGCEKTSERMLNDDDDKGRRKSFLSEKGEGESMHVEWGCQEKRTGGIV